MSAVAVAAMVLAILAVLLGSGGGALSPPPLGSPGRWAAWLDRREPVPAAFALLRLAALAGIWYLAAVTCLGALLRALRAVRLVAVTDRFTVAPVRRLLAGTVTAGLVGLGPIGAAAAQPAAPTTTTPTALSTSSTSSTSTAVPSSNDTVVLRRLPPDAPAPASKAAAPAAPATPSERAPARWTVEPGDCFWTIAEQVLEQAWDRAPTDGEIVPYWRALIEANRQTLADKGNADLIFPGQVFDVPAPPPAAPLARTG